MYSRKAKELIDLIKKEVDVEFVVNAEKPRRGAFEFVLSSPNSEGASDFDRPTLFILRSQLNAITDLPALDEVLWTGLKKGPPRRLKFPEGATLVENLRKHIK